MFRRLSKIGETMIDPELTVLHSGHHARRLAALDLHVAWQFAFGGVHNRSFTREIERDSLISDLGFPRR